jgi:ABC-type glycerol-3-phosphate transport system permease component
MEKDIFASPPIWIPSTPTTEAYSVIFTLFKFGESIMNSIIVAAATTIITLALAVPAAYGFSRYKFPGSNLMLLGIIFCRMIIPSSLILPLYEVMRLMRLLDTPVAIIISHLTYTVPFTIWFLKGFFDELPAEIEEAGMIDGMYISQILLRLILPLAAPAIAVASMFAFVFSWNEFMFATSLATSFRTGPVAIAGMVSTYKIWWAEIAAAGIILSLPILILSFWLQKYLVRGLTFGAVK